MTDENPAYRLMGREMTRAVINHSLAYVEKLTHTNTIEGFWALIKRGWYETHHHYSKKSMPLYIAEACWKYNRRKQPDSFVNVIGRCLGTMTREL